MKVKQKVKQTFNAIKWDGTEDGYYDVKEFFRNTKSPDITLQHAGELIRIWGGGDHPAILYPNSIIVDDGDYLHDGFTIYTPAKFRKKYEILDD